MILKCLLDNVTDLRKFYNSFSTVRPDDLADIKTPKLKKHVKRLSLKDEYVQTIVKSSKSGYPVMDTLIITGMNMCREDEQRTRNDYFTSFLSGRMLPRLNLIKMFNPKYLLQDVKIFTFIII